MMGHYPRCGGNLTTENWNVAYLPAKQVNPGSLALPESLAEWVVREPIAYLNPVAKNAP